MERSSINRLLLLFVTCFLMLPSLVMAQKKKEAKTLSLTPAVNNNDYYKTLIWRNVGPTRGGRAEAISGVTGNPLVYYMGSTGGGVWKTEDAGLNWHNISDGFFKTSSVGAIAVSESDPNEVIVGMGEHAPRGVTTSYGDGIYKSTDAGKTWKHLGLDLTRHISAIRINPSNPDIIFVAALGAIHGASPERGIFRSQDGGKSWTKIFFIDENTGCADLSMDMANPRILYAAMWDYRRLPWEMRSGGPGSGLYKSEDGGETWFKVQVGLPKELGKISVSICQSNPDKVYALVESDTQKEQGGLFVTEDGGKQWNRISKDHRLVQRAWYFLKVFADPQQEDKVYVLSSPGLVSKDGGRNWDYLGGTHGDYHMLWINSHNDQNMLIANDGGAAVTFNAGRSWSTQNNQPTAQFYRVNADNAFPYNLYGGQQDNTSVKIASQYIPGWEISDREWSYSAGGESAFLAFDPNNPRYVMGGSYQGTIELQDTKLHEGTEVMEYPVQYQSLQPKDMQYRFNWNAPIIYSEHEPGVFYHGGNVLFKTTDMGRSWKAISPDLTTHDTSKMGMSGTPYTNEGAGGENYCTLTYIKESPHEKGVIYTGSDDGVVSLTRDGGLTWNNITPAAAKGALINAIEVSPFDKGTAYIAVTRYKFNDFTPMLFKTTDFGATWTSISNGIPYGAFTRVVREDPAVKDLLYAGTETGFYISWNGGADWQQLQLNLPVTPITDLKIHQGHLLASTQGRAFWILDDLKPLRLKAATVQSFAKLFPVDNVYRLSGGSMLDRAWNNDEELSKINTVSANPATGAVIYYHIALKDSVKHISIEILDSNNQHIRTFYNEKPKFQGSNNSLDSDPKIEIRNGLNRFVWDLYYPNLPSVANVFIEGSYNGRKAIPGQYKVILKVNDSIYTSSFNILPDPRLDTKPGDFVKQDALLKKIAVDVTDIHVAVVKMRKVQDQLQGFLDRAEPQDSLKQLVTAAKEIRKKLTDWEEYLIQPKSQSNDDVINFVNKLSANFIFLKGEVEGSSVPVVTAGAQSRFDELHAEWKKYEALLTQILNKDLKLFNQSLKDRNWEYVGQKD